MSGTIQGNVSDLRQAVERYRNQLKAVKIEGQRMAVLGTHAVLTAGGGAIVGVLRVHAPKIGGKIDTPLLVGSALCTAALLDIGGDYSDEMNALGAGMLAAVAATETEAMLRARQQQKAA